MSEKGILSSKAPSVGEAEERVSDNGNRRAGTKGKGRKEPPSATVVRKEASVSKPLGEASRMGEDLLLGKVAEVTEVSLVEAMILKMSAKVSSLKAMTSKVSTEVPSMATPMPTKSLDVSC